MNYFRIGSMKQKLQSIDEHLRRMLRVIIWKQWKTAKKREWGLLKLEVPNGMHGGVRGRSKSALLDFYGIIC